MHITYIYNARILLSWEDNTIESYGAKISFFQNYRKLIRRMSYIRIKLM